MIKAGTTRDVGIRKIEEQLARFQHLKKGLESNTLNAQTLKALEILDPIFKDC